MLCFKNIIKKDYFFIVFSLLYSIYFIFFLIFRNTDFISAFISILPVLISYLLIVNRNQIIIIVSFILVVFICNIYFLFFSKEIYLFISFILSNFMLVSYFLLSSLKKIKVEINHYRIILVINFLSFVFFHIVSFEVTNYYKILQINNLIFILFFIYNLDNHKMNKIFKSLNFDSIFCFVIVLIMLLNKYFSKNSFSEFLYIFSFSSLIKNGVSLLCAPFIEELLYRFIYFEIFPLKNKSLLKNIIIIIFNILVFFVAHIRYGYKLSFNPLSFILSNILLTIIYVRYKNLKLNVLVHFIYNLLVS